MFKNRECNYFKEYNMGSYQPQQINPLEYIESRIKMIEEEITNLHNRISTLETTITNNQKSTNNMYMI